MYLIYAMIVSFGKKMVVFRIIWAYICTQNYKYKFASPLQLKRFRPVGFFEAQRVVSVRFDRNIFSYSYIVTLLIFVLLMVTK